MSNKVYENLGSNPSHKGESVTPLATKELMISYTIQCLKQNMSWQDTIKALCDEFKMSDNKAQRIYNKTLAKLREYVNEDILDVRAKRITALEKDIQTAWDMFSVQGEYSPVKQKWFETYLKTKDQLDKYYPDLNKDSISGSAKISIVYTDAKAEDVNHFSSDKDELEEDE